MTARPFSRSFLALCLLLTGMAAVAFSATSQWQFTPTPDPGTWSQLRGVDALSSPDEAWAVGWTEGLVGSVTQYYGIALRWDGTSWTHVPTPNPSTALGTSVYLYDVKMVAGGDAWAVGTYQTPHEVDGAMGHQAFTLHWDGTSWTQVKAPQTPAGGTGGFLFRVDALSAGDVWAVGTRAAPDSNATAKSYGFTLHWDGSKWTELPPTPVVTRGDHELRGLSALAPDQIWTAGGHSTNNTGGAQSPYVNRWTGSGWELHTSLPVLGYYSYLQDIAAIAPDDVWVVGQATMDGYYEPYLAHYDGASWELVRPPLNHRSAWLMSVSAFSADDIWAAGAYSEDDRVQRPLLLHYDGTAWTEMPADPEGPAGGWFRNVSTYRDAGGAPQAWAVGSRNPGTHAQRLGDGGTIPPPPPPPATVLKSLTLNPTSITGGKAATGAVALNSAAPAGGLKVLLASSDTASATVPASVTLPEGSSSISFKVNTKPVRQATAVGISASVPGETTSGTLTVLPPVLTRLSLSATIVPGGCKTLTGRVTLDGKAPAGGLVVTLANTNPAASVPAQVAIPAGYNTATFPVTTVAVTSVQTGTVTATLDGVSKAIALKVRPIGVTKLVLSPNPVVGPGQVTGTVTLECAAAPGNIVVALSSSSAAVAKPTATSLTIPVGSATGSFSVTTADVTAVSYATIRAAANGTARSVRLTVNP